MIDPKEVIARYSVEELAETADQYYRAVSDATPLMAKPFWFLHETPEALHNLGLLLGGLRLGKTMTVLDFGAGTCWLSRFLAQLHCRVVCCDTSRTALAIGERLFRELPPLGTETRAPRFLWFDGHHLDLPDASIDRVICFDAFHHVPNQREVLAELGRVLKPGGIAGFSEPGRRHSQSPQSQYEMANHKVLENDIDVNAIFALARPAGFTRLALRVVNDMEISLDDHNVMFGGGNHDALESEIWNQTYNAMHNRAIFVLHKGEPVADSRSHEGLGHRLTIDGVEQVGPVGARAVRVRLTLANTGAATWLHDNDGDIFGVVRIGTHLYDGLGNLLAIDHSRHELPHAVRPGETISTTVTVPLPGPTTYRLTFDLVAEGVTWFENIGSTPASVEA